MIDEAEPGVAAPPEAGAAEAGRARGRGRTQYAIAALAALVALGLLALLGYGMLRRQGGGFAGFAVNTVGQSVALTPRPAPDFALQLFDGQPFRLSEQRGSVVVANFWASWCPPCREEARTLEAVSRRYRERGVVFVGVDVWDAERDALAFIREFGVTYPNGPDPTGGILIEYGVTGIPETYFVDRAGRLVRRWIGPIDARQLDEAIEPLLE